MIPESSNTYGPSLFGSTLSVNPAISSSPFLTIDRANTAKSRATIHPLTDFLLRSLKDFSWDTKYFGNLTQCGEDGNSYDLRIAVSGHGMGARHLAS